MGNLSNKFSLFVAVLVFINRSDRVVRVPYLDTRVVCSFCLAIRLISNTVLLLNKNGYSLRRALADNFIVTIVWDIRVVNSHRYVPDASPIQTLTSTLIRLVSVLCTKWR